MTGIDGTPTRLKMLFFFLGTSCDFLTDRESLRKSRRNVGLLSWTSEEPGPPGSRHSVSAPLRVVSQSSWSSRTQAAWGTNECQDVVKCFRVGEWIRTLASSYAIHMFVGSMVLLNALLKGTVADTRKTNPGCIWFLRRGLEWEVSQQVSPHYYKSNAVLGRM